MRRNPARWRSINARLGRESSLWIATVRPDGRPHLTPVWFVWLDEKIYIATGTDTQKFFNLRENQSVALALPDSDKVVILEGEAHAVDRETSDRIAQNFINKFEWDFRVDDTADWRLIEITIHKVLAWGDGYENDGIRVF